MKLVSCRIGHFGRLADFTYHFEEDLSVLLAENGWGKSTLAAFLKVMFYGFEGENRRSEDGNERLRYRPWEGGVCGGSVTFSRGERTYRMHRTFGTRKKEDTFVLLDDDTGLVSSDFTENIGEELFGIDRESFCRTVFWSQRDHETEATTLIQAKIGDLSQEPDDLPSYDLAMRRLKKEIERLSPDRASGQIRRKEEQAAVLEAEAARLPLLNSQLTEIRAKKRSLDASLEKIRSERQAFVVNGAKAYRASDAASDASSPAEKDADAAAAAPALHDDGSAEQAALYAQLHKSQRRLAMLRRARRDAAIAGHGEREAYVRVRKERRAAELSVSEEYARRRNRCLAASAVSCTASVILFALIPAGILPPLAAAAACALLIAGAASLFIMRGTDFPEDSPALISLREEESALRASLHALRGRMQRAEEKARDEERILQSIRIKIRQGEARAEQTGQNSAAKGVRASAALSAQELSDRLAPSLAEFDMLEEACRRQIADAGRQEEALRSMIAECTESSEKLADVRREIGTLREQHRICVQTSEYLEKARGSFTSRYRNPFMRSFRRHYAMLTGESAEEAAADADFRITLMEAGLPRDPSLMSEGTRDLIALCRRMALIDAMYPGEKPFLVLDDPFANLDDERVKGGIRFLQNASHDYQILYLTCHKSRV